MREVPVGQEPLEEPQPRVVLGEPRRLAPLEVGVPLVGPVFVVLGEPGRAHWIPPVRVEVGPLVGWALPAGRAPPAERAPQAGRVPLAGRYPPVGSARLG